jgi:hypothetical protein
MAKKFIEILGPLEIRTGVDEEWRAKTDELGPQLMSDAWLYRERRPQASRDVPIRAVVEVREDIIANVSLSGDFFFYPQESFADLEDALSGVELGDVEQTLARFYEERDIESPGVAPHNFSPVLTA